MSISSFAIPAIILLILTYALFKRVKVYDVFLVGASEGLSTLLRIIPSIVGLLVAIGMFRASGAMDLLCRLFEPISKFIMYPSELVPIAFMRPISGGASVAIITDVFSKYGPDSFLGRICSIMAGATETTFYTITVYFGAVGIKNIRHSIKAALCADVTAILLSAWIAKLFF